MLTNVVSTYITKCFWRASMKRKALTAKDRWTQRAQWGAPWQQPQRSKYCWPQQLRCDCGDTIRPSVTPIAVNHGFNVYMAGPSLWQNLDKNLIDVWRTFGQGVLSERLDYQLLFSCNGLITLTNIIFWFKRFRSIVLIVSFVDKTTLTFDRSTIEGQRNKHTRALSIYRRYTYASSYCADYWDYQQSLRLIIE